MRRPALAGVALALLAACGAGDQPGGPGLPGGPTPPPRGRTTGLTASAAIGPAGGSISLIASAGALTLTIPAGALSAAVTFSLSEIIPVGLLGGVGSGYRIDPLGTPVSLPATLTFTPPAGTSPTAVMPAYQGATGYWYRAYAVTRDAATVATQSTDLHDWSLVAVAAQRDLSGPFRLDSTERLTHTATGSATLQYLGGSGTSAAYLPQGTITLATPVAKGSASCTTATATMALPDSVAEATLTRFDWGINGQWALSCTDASSDFVSTNFDSLGITSIGCARSYLVPPVIGPNLIQGTYKIDCGLDGAVTATWNLQGTSCGQPCATPPNPCFAGVLQCGSGTAACGNGAQLAAGTSCGTNLVCSAAGVCGACTTGATCTSTNACHTAAVACGSGAPVCTDSGNLPNGASCGAGLVCNGGVCGACAQGAACLSLNPCDATATTECSSGAPVCIDRTFQPTGTSCGTNLVCAPSGACVACTAGASCASTNACHTAAISCSSSAPVCTDTGNAPDGSSCGAGFVCSGGVCGACAAGATCVSTNLCHAAAIVCSTGVPVCTDNGTIPNGTSCGTGMTCNAALCVASRAVTGARLITFWPDTGAQPIAALDVAGAQVKAMVASGGVTYPGTFAADGSFSIPTVPAGNYLLQLDAGGLTTLVDTSASVLDLGSDALGRSGLVPSSGATPVTLQVSGLTAWSAGDQLQITSGNADVWDALDTSALLAGATTATLPEDWFASASAGRPQNLLAATDVLFVHQLHAGSFTIGAAQYAYRAASNATSLTGIALTDRTAATITAVLAASAQTGSIAVHWSLSQFEPFLAQMNPSATTLASAHALVVGASPFALTAAGPLAHGTPSLFVLQAPSLTGDLDLATPLSYGHLDTGTAPAWNEWRGVSFTGQVSYFAPGAATALVEQVSVGRREPMAAAGPIVPTLGPVLSPLITSTAGLASSAFSTLTGLGLAPKISWTAPATGVPSSYTVDLYRLYLPTPSTSGSVRVASWRTNETSIALPAGVLAAGQTYYARITANLVSPDTFATAPFRKINVYAWAGALTGTFAP